MLNKRCCVILVSFMVIITIMDEVLINKFFEMNLSLRMKTICNKESKTTGYEVSGNEA